LVRIAQEIALTEPKRVDIALVRYDVVDDTCRSDPALALAHSAQRLDLQLMARPLAPTFPVQMAPSTHAQSLARGQEEEAVKQPGDGPQMAISKSQCNSNCYKRLSRRGD